MVVVVVVVVVGGGGGGGVGVGVGVGDSVGVVVGSGCGGGGVLSCPEEGMGLLPEHEMAHNVAIPKDMAGDGAAPVDRDELQLNGCAEICAGKPGKILVQNFQQRLPNPSFLCGADVHMQIRAATNRDERARNWVSGAGDVVELHLVHTIGRFQYCTTLHLVGSSRGLLAFRRES